MKTLTVNDLQKLLTALQKQGKITGQTEVWLSGDEEGNRYSPLIQTDDGAFNVGWEENRSKIIFYPS